jgi:hypothetical protein
MPLRRKLSMRRNLNGPNGPKVFAGKQVLAYQEIFRKLPGKSAGAVLFCSAGLRAGTAGAAGGEWLINYIFYQRRSTIMKMLTGVPKNERWWLWAALLWIILSLGPGLELANKPVFIGLFPMLYVWSFTFYIISLILITILCYRMTFHKVPENIISIYDEEKAQKEKSAAEGSADHG